MNGPHRVGSAAARIAFASSTETATTVPRGIAGGSTAAATFRPTYSKLVAHLSAPLKSRTLDLFFGIEGSDIDLVALTVFAIVVNPNRIRTVFPLRDASFDASAFQARCFCDARCSTVRHLCSSERASKVTRER